MDRFTLLLTLILQLTKQPAADSASACDTNPRACNIARDFIAAVDAAPRLPFDGPAAKETADVLLLAVAFHESGLRESVQDCTYCDTDPRACDGGRSMSMFQLMRGRAWGKHTKEEICSDNRLAARLALHWLTRFSNGGLPAMFQSYAGCARRACVASRQLQSQFEVLLGKTPLRPAPRCGARFYDFAAPVVQCPPPPTIGRL